MHTVTLQNCMYNTWACQQCYIILIVIDSYKVFVKIINFFLLTEFHLPILKDYRLSLCAQHRLCNRSCLCIIIYVAKYWLFGVLLVKNCQEKYSCCFLFALRCWKYDGHLSIHSRSSTTPVSLILLVGPLRATGSKGQMLGMSCGELEQHRFRLMNAAFMRLLCRLAKTVHAVQNTSNCSVVL